MRFKARYLVDGVSNLEKINAIDQVKADEQARKLAEERTKITGKNWILKAVEQV